MMPTASMRRIQAVTRRRVMDWSLVLASQGIDAEMARDDTGYHLHVEEKDYSTAIQALLEYTRENRGRGRPARAVPGRPFKLHPAAWLWALVMVACFILEETRPGFKEAGLMDSRRVAEGEWWRPLTAMGLHEDAAHLVSNLTFGVIFLGLAMEEFKPWPALLLSSLAGAGGYLLGWLVDGPDYRSLGVSGLVMAALGLLAASAAARGRREREGGTGALRGLGASGLMLVLIGFSPKADVAAHLGGFLFGVLGGMIWLRKNPEKETGRGGEI